MEKSSRMEVILTRPYYALYEDIKDGELRIEALGIVDRKDYPSIIKLGAWMDEGELYVQPYFEDKVRGTKLVKVKGIAKEVDAIAVTVQVERSVAEEIEKICIASNGKPYQKYDEESSDYVYYLPPKEWEVDDRTGKKRFKKIVNEHVAVGSETIQIHWKNKLHEPEQMHLISGYEEDKDFFQELILDLIAMNQKLVVDEKSTLSISEKPFLDLYQQTEQIVKEFCQVFWKLEKNVQPALILSCEKQSFHKVKKITSKALIEHEVFHKDKVTANVYREDFDTFEHRVIRTFVEKLKKMIKIRQHMEIMELENKISDFKEYQLPDEEAEEIEKDFQNALQKERKAREEQLEKTLLSTNVKKVRLQFQLEDSLYYNVKKGYSGNERWVRLWGMNLNLTDDRNRCRGYEANRNRWEEIAFSNDNIKEISFPINCKDAAIMFFKYLPPDKHEFFAEGDKIEIYGEIEANYDKNAGYVFRFRNVEEIRKVVYEDSFSMYFGLSEEKTYRKAWLSEDEKNKLMEAYKAFVLDLDSSNMDHENYALFTALKNGAEKARELKNEKENSVEKIKEKWGALESHLDKLLKNSFMEKVSNIRTEFQISNLFLFHPDYQKIYKIMKKDFQQLEGVDYYRKDVKKHISIAGVADLYERWCCLKMVFTFMHLYGFELMNCDKEGRNGVESFKQYISDVLEGQDTLSQTKFELVGRRQALENMKVTIWYEPAIDIGGRMPLRPDLVLKITKKGFPEKSHLFVFDAKYRGIHKDDYDHYDGVADICNVALRQYILRLEKGIKEGIPFYDRVLPDKKISGSFILHSNSEAVWEPDKNLVQLWENKVIPGNEQGVDLVYNPQRYLGAFIDVWSERWFDAVRQYEAEQNHAGKNRNRILNISSAQVSLWSEWKIDLNNNENRLGIAVLNPKDNKLVYIIQMIMEKYYGYYKEVCWLCGKKVETKKKYTGVGYRKYHVTCVNCEKLTVETHCINYRNWVDYHTGKRLGKHVENYYVQSKKEDKNSCWNVACPICRKKLPNNEGEEYIDDARWNMYLNNYN